MITHKWWCRWRVPGDDPRPVKVPTPVNWWRTGESGMPGEYQIVCGTVMAEDEKQALESIQQNGWPECQELNFCEPRSLDWEPPSDRFPPE